jgi:hypothetical protein
LTAFSPRQFRERVELRQAQAAALVGRSRACPFDLQQLLPVPATIPALGPSHPAAPAWLSAEWGLTDRFRQVAERRPTPGRRLPPGHDRPARRRLARPALHVAAATARLSRVGMDGSEADQEDGEGEGRERPSSCWTDSAGRWLALLLTLAQAQAQRIELARMPLGTLVDQLVGGGTAARTAPPDTPLGRKGDWVVMAVPAAAAPLAPAASPVDAAPFAVPARFDEGRLGCFGNFGFAPNPTQSCQVRTWSTKGIFDPLWVLGCSMSNQRPELALERAHTTPVSAVWPLTTGSLLGPVTRGP